MNKKCLKRFGISRANGKGVNEDSIYVEVRFSEQLNILYRYLLSSSIPVWDMKEGLFLCP